MRGNFFLMRFRAASLVFLLALVLVFAVACGLVPSSSSGVRPPPAGKLSISFIDVGQGDSILVQAAGANYLIDAGRPEEGPNVVDFLRSRGVEKLDGVVASHDDADHIGGLPAVFDAFRVENVYISGDDKGTLTYNAFLRSVRAEHASVQEVRAGYRMFWGGVRCDVIGPPPGQLSEESNDNSVAILLTYGEARVLFAGDAEANEEEYMASGMYTGPLTVLKIDHHGSNTSSTPLFLNRFAPEVAVIQVGADNPYGHPTPETLDRLHRAGVKIFRTDEDGDIIVTIDQKEATIAVTKPKGVKQASGF